MCKKQCPNIVNVLGSPLGRSLGNVRSIDDGYSLDITYLHTLFSRLNS